VLLSEQRTSQLPHARGSVARSMHAPRHALKPSPHVAAQAPRLQTAAELLHVTPQAPQFCGSLLKATQTPLQLDSSARPHVVALPSSPASPGLEAKSGKSSDLVHVARVRGSNSAAAERLRIRERSTNSAAQADTKRNRFDMLASCDG